MSKWQRLGWVISMAIFIILGVVFWLLGDAHNDTTLKTMGYFWMMAGLFNVILYVVITSQIKKK
jgi:uncharacterized membrane protein